VAMSSFKHPDSGGGHDRRSLYTPELRGRGYARAAVAASLRDVRTRGFPRRSSLPVIPMRPLSRPISRSDSGGSATYGCFPPSLSGALYIRVFEGRRLAHFVL
jgi:hypothetical protein